MPFWIFILIGTYVKNISNISFITLLNCFCQFHFIYHFLLRGLRNPSKQSLVCSLCSEIQLEYGQLYVHYLTNTCWFICCAYNALNVPSINRIKNFQRIFLENEFFKDMGSRKKTQDTGVGSRGQYKLIISGYYTFPCLSVWAGFKSRHVAFI